MYNRVEYYEERRLLWYEIINGELTANGLIKIMIDHGLDKHARKSELVKIAELIIKEKRAYSVSDFGVLRYFHLTVRDPNGYET